MTDTYSMESWMYFFLLGFLGLSVLIIAASWLGSRRKKHKWEKRCEEIKQEASRREVEERASWTRTDWDRNRGIEDTKVKEVKRI